jgi:hypothetical protein
LLKTGKDKININKKDSMEDNKVIHKQEEGSSDIIFSSNKLSIPPAITIATFIVLFLLVFALLTGHTYRFYASFLFLFYSWIGKIWVAVVLLGVFQTLLMIPFRIVNLRRSIHIKEFVGQLEQVKGNKSQKLFLKKRIRKGDINVLWYIVNFFIQIISYLSIGRLFLIDFYNKKIDPDMLYSFAPYPDYPIQDTFFKIPYPVFTKTIDFGIVIMLIVWAAAIGYKITVNKLKPIYRKMKQTVDEKKDKPVLFLEKLVRNTSGSLFLLLIAGWLITRYFPVGWQIKIFSGDVSRPYPTFNLITAIMTFSVVIWLDIPKIRKKVKLARQEHVEDKIIKKTQVSLFKNTFQKALFLGLGAYFITNRIPCAFELSIFTFEVISIFSPLTIDRLILKVPVKK